MRRPSELRYLAQIGGHPNLGDMVERVVVRPLGKEVPEKVNTLLLAFCLLEASGQEGLRELRHTESVVRTRVEYGAPFAGSTVGFFSGDAL